MTVRNEAGSLSALLDSVVAQTVQPNEIVIVDGGSTDGTQEIARAYSRWLHIPLRLIEQPRANISEGRNRAIREARYSTVAVTDAGVKLDRRWLELLLEPMKDSGTDIASGFFLPDSRTPFEMAMGATVLPQISDINPDTFLPSSRSIAFRKAAWESIGGYPEWLDYCEDLVFDLDLKRTGHRFAFASDALVYFRPRSSLQAFFRQYFRYARGDGKANLWKKRHAARYATYLVGPILAWVGWRQKETAAGLLMLGLVGAGGIGYCRRPYARLLPSLRDMPLHSAAYALAMIPIIRLTGDIAKMLGYPVGVLWRLKKRSVREMGAQNLKVGS